METKACTKCGKELPATVEYFYSQKGAKNGLTGQCKECIKERSRRWSFENKEKRKETRLENLEKHRDRERKYAKDNKERIAEYNKMWREENKNHIKEYAKKYREANKDAYSRYDKSESRKEYFKVYRLINKDKRNEYNRMHRKVNPEYYRDYVQKKNARKRRLRYDLKNSEWSYSKKVFGKRCAYCGVSTSLEQDHFWPSSKGGGYTRTNIIPACRSCNSSKNNKPFEEWYPTHESYSPEREAKIYQYFEQLALENGGWGRQRYDLGTVTIEVINEDL